MLQLFQHFQDRITSDNNSNINVTLAGMGKDNINSFDCAVVMGDTSASNIEVPGRVSRLVNGTSSSGDHVRRIQGFQIKGINFGTTSPSFEQEGKVKGNLNGVLGTPTI